MSSLPFRCCRGGDRTTSRSATMLTRSSWVPGIPEVPGPPVEVLFSGGQATWRDDIELIVRRHGFAGRCEPSLTKHSFTVSIRFVKVSICRTFVLLFRYWRALQGEFFPPQFFASRNSHPLRCVITCRALRSGSMRFPVISTWRTMMQRRNFMLKSTAVLALGGLALAGCTANRNAGSRSGCGRCR